VRECPSQAPLEAFNTLVIQKAFRYIIGNRPVQTNWSGVQVVNESSAVLVARMNVIEVIVFHFC
jgi:hypothetical protein